MGHAAHTDTVDEACLLLVEGAERAARDYGDPAALRAGVAVRSARCRRRFQALVELGVVQQNAFEPVPHGG